MLFVLGISAISVPLTRTTDALPSHSITRTVTPSGSTLVVKRAMADGKYDPRNPASFNRITATLGRHASEVALQVSRAPRKDQPGMLATAQADGIKALGLYNLGTGDVPHHEWAMHLKEFLLHFEGAKYDQNSPDGKLVKAVRKIVDDHGRNLGNRGYDIEGLAYRANERDLALRTERGYSGSAGNVARILETGFKG